MRHRQLRDDAGQLARTLERCETQAAQVETLTRVRGRIARRPARTGAAATETRRLDPPTPRADRRPRPDRGIDPVRRCPRRPREGRRPRRTNAPAARRRRDGHGPRRPRPVARPARLGHVCGCVPARTRRAACTRPSGRTRHPCARRSPNSARTTSRRSRDSSNAAKNSTPKSPPPARRSPRCSTATKPRKPSAAVSPPPTASSAALETELALARRRPYSSRSELEAAEQAANVRHEQARAARETLGRQAKKARETAQRSRRLPARKPNAHAHQTARRRRKPRATGRRRLRGRYPDGVQPALDTALFAYAETKFALQKAQEKLPPDAATLGERNRRAAAAAAQVQGELDRQAPRAATRFADGSNGSAPRRSTPSETDLLAEHAALTVQAERARARSRAARLVHDLIERRKQAATRTVLAPVAGPARRAVRAGQRRARTAHFPRRIPQHPWPRPQAGRTRRLRRSLPGGQGTTAPLPAPGGRGGTHRRAGRRPAVA